ncbi:MAG: alanine--tRNA ligase-related protein, partial [Pyrinomonadaceae bacterium]
AYPELEVQRGFIGKMVQLEEERFGNTLTVGLGKLNELQISRDDGFFQNIAKLYDTYGTPRDLIRVFLEEKGVEFEEEEFNDKFDSALQMLQQQGGIGKTERKAQISPIYTELHESVGDSKFHGYDATHVDDVKVAALVKDDKRVDELKEGDEGLVVLSDTPFYAEAGGQVGDTGTAHATADGSDMRTDVVDTFSPISGLIIHKVAVGKGSIKVGDKVTATVDVQKRDATRRNHTATHLVHAALREVLGTHVKQAGSVVAPNYLRFDFTHYQRLTDAEITEIEDLVNRYILENQPVNTNVMAIEEAMHSGAMALFGEKYGADVRVLSVGDGKFSTELCGGTHVRATGDIGSFKITSDEAIASGVRRIRAITGFDAFERFREDERLIDRSLAALKTQRDNLPAAIEKLQQEVKLTRKEIDDLRLKIATGAGDASTNGDEPKLIAGVRVIGKIVEGIDGNGARQLSNTLLNRLNSGVVVLGRKDEGKASIIVRVSSDLTNRVKAGNVIKEIVAIVGGRGGGKPDMAEGGGNEPDKLGEAIDASYKVIESFLNS